MRILCSLLKIVKILQGGHKLRGKQKQRYFESPRDRVSQVRMLEGSSCGKKKSVLHTGQICRCGLKKSCTDGCGLPREANFLQKE
jgi:hypothetical protein